MATHPPRPDQPHPAPTSRADPTSRAGLLDHLRAPAALGGHEFGDWPAEQLAAWCDGDLDARHRRDHTTPDLQQELPHLHDRPGPTSPPDRADQADRGQRARRWDRERPARGEEREGLPDGR